MKELASLHDKHLNRPTLDDSSEEEHAIEITTQEITQVRAQVQPRHGRLQRHRTPIPHPAGDVLGFHIPARRPHRDYELSACCGFLGGLGTIFRLLVDPTVFENVKTRCSILMHLII